MASIHYLAELDKVNAYQTYKPLVLDMTKEQLEILILMLINGSDLEYAFDLTVSLKTNP